MSIHLASCSLNLQHTANNKGCDSSLLVVFKLLRKAPLKPLCLFWAARATWRHKMARSIEGQPTFVIYQTKFDKVGLNYLSLELFSAPSNTKRCIVSTKSLLLKLIWKSKTVDIKMHHAEILSQPFHFTCKCWTWWIKSQLECNKWNPQLKAY